MIASNGYDDLGTFSGDFAIITEVDSDTTSPDAGISIRAGTSPTAGTVANVSLLTTYDSGSFGVDEIERNTAGGTYSSLGVHTGYSTGTYLALGRTGDTFFGYTSSNGLDWSPIGSLSNIPAVPALNGTVTVELIGTSAATTQGFVSFSNSTLATATVATVSPASSSNVIAVGGTTLTTNTIGTTTTITSGGFAWGSGPLSLFPASSGFGGSGGGISTVEAEPAYQLSVAPYVNLGGMRGVPDVSFDAGAEAMNQFKRFTRVVRDAGVAAKIANDNRGGWGEYGGIAWIAQVKYEGPAGGQMTMQIDLAEAAWLGQKKIDLNRQSTDSAHFTVTT